MLQLRGKVMKQNVEIDKKPFLTGMNIFFLAVAIFMPVFSEVNRYYIRYVNSRVEYSFGDLITVSAPAESSDMAGRVFRLCADTRSELLSASL